VTGPGTDDRVVTSSDDGRLILAATPIGDVEDASGRLARLIATADIVAAEDTRRLRRLARALGVVPAGRVVSFHEHNETLRVAQLVDAVRAGGTVLVVTDAGMPGVSDPGLRAVRAAIAAGIPVTAAPGPSAVVTALVLSGLPSDRFCFEGFLPRRSGERRRALVALQADPRTMIFFEAPHRLRDTLADMAELLGVDRPAAVARELTKTYEEVRRQPLGELLAWAGAGEVLGELTIVVAGRPAPPPPTADDLAELAELVRGRVDAGQRLKQAVAEVAVGAGVSKRELYAAAIRGRA
jgi:16S rRNA (cytidine1402-2'-O)-methyltransferase